MSFAAKSTPLFSSSPCFIVTSYVPFLIVSVATINDSRCEGYKILLPGLIGFSNLESGCFNSNPLSARSSLTETTVEDRSLLAKDIAFDAPAVNSFREEIGLRGVKGSSEKEVT